jgi:hypothetical protein
MKTQKQMLENLLKPKFEMMVESCTVCPENPCNPKVKAKGCITFTEPHRVYICPFESTKKDFRFLKMVEMQEEYE